MNEYKEEGNIGKGGIWVNEETVKA